MSNNDEDTNSTAEEQERNSLRTIRNVLHEETKQLRREFKSTHASTDVAALRKLSKRLMQHNDKLARFYSRLEAFHQRYGPLGK